MLQETFCYGDVLLRRRFVTETFCMVTFCRGDVLCGDVLYVRQILYMFSKMSAFKICIIVKTRFFLIL
jgi:hypothetical protein